MHASTKKRFNKISDRFIKNQYDLSTIRWIINEIRNTLWDITEDEFEMLMNIPKNILKEDVYIEDYEIWKNENKSYLLKNLEGFNEEYFEKLKEKISCGTYSIEDMIETIDYIKDNFNDLKEKYSGNMEAVLRNIEFAFRSLKLSNKEKLTHNKELFYKSIQNIINEAI